MLAVIGLHFMDNLSGEMFGLSDAARPYRLWLAIGLAAIVVGRWGPGTLRRGGATAEAH